MPQEGTGGVGTSEKIQKLKSIEASVQEFWQESRAYEVEPVRGKAKKLVCAPYPYMNGSLHIGHALTYSRVDVYARLHRLLGFNVLFPFAWHWTGEPIVGLAKRVKEGEQRAIDSLTKGDLVPESELAKFTDPIYLANYFTKEGRLAAARLGLSVDWRRQFTTAHNTGYSKFIEWQYVTLRERGYIAQGTHPVVWCPFDMSPTGDHDRAEGEGVSPDEMALVFFPLEGNASFAKGNDVFFVAATYRPETIFGATNIWIRADGEYVIALVDGRKWLISSYCADVLADQKHKVEVIASVRGRELLGASVRNPLSQTMLPVLPGEFVDTRFGTGVVYSVPAHAPYDYLALRDLRKLTPAELQGLNLSRELIDSLEPVSIIKVRGYGEFPAIEECEKVGARDQNDPLAQKATETLYRAEFHTGTLKENCDGFATMSVAQAKVEIQKRLVSLGLGGTYLELPQAVICRCGNRCRVKILENQWFLRYSDPAWKRKAKEALSSMEVYPPEARQWFTEVIDWLQDKACARKSGMGTKLPWDPEWIVETLSDSTVYMSYYTVSKFVNSKEIDPEKLNRAFFDFIFYGSGSLDSVARTCGLDASVVESVKNEFDYWYPVDLRNSAKELISNHLTFFIFHHCALFPEKDWPRAVSANGMLTVEGAHMHKSKGNSISMKSAIDAYGADVTRVTLLNGNEGLDDPDWNQRAALEAVDKLYAFVELVEEVKGWQKTGSEFSDVDEWFRATLKLRASEVARAVSAMRIRAGLNSALFETWEDYRRYIRRSAKLNTSALPDYLKDWTRLLHPFIPHLAQWAFNQLGGEGLIEESGYVEQNLSESERLVLAREEYARKLEADVLNLLHLVTGADTIEIAVASPQKVAAFKGLVSDGVAPGRMSPEVVQTVSAAIGDRRLAPALSQRLIKVFAEWKSQPLEVVVSLSESETDTLKSLVGYLERAYGLKVRIVREDESEDPRRAANAIPLKPSLTLFKTDSKTT